MSHRNIQYHLDVKTQSLIIHQTGVAEFHRAMGYLTAWGMATHQDVRIYADWNTSTGLLGVYYLADGKRDKVIRAEYVAGRYSFHEQE